MAVWNYFTHANPLPPTRDTKNQNFPVGKKSSAKTFRTKCVNRFRDIYEPKKRKSLSRHICAKSAKIAFTTYMPKCQNSSYKSARYGCCNNTANNKIFVGKVSRWSGKFPDSPETFYSVRKLSTLSRKFPDYLVTFQTNWKLSRLSGNFLDQLETFRTVWKLPGPFWKLSGPSGKFPDRLESFQTVWKIFRLSGNFPNCLEIFQTVWKLSRLS